jgi:hypothetical protein
MITVATQLEAPAKLLFLGSAQNIAEGKYAASCSCNRSVPRTTAYPCSSPLLPYPCSVPAIPRHSRTRYPFSVLGLGDIAIPGAFVALLRQV